jgi:hypothetical protein
MAVQETSATQQKGTSTAKKPLIMSRFLPADFVPSACDVMVGRGKKCTDHSGNKRLRCILRTRLQEYAAANDKTHKTHIISQVFHAVQKGSSCGGFVKHDSDTGRWYRVMDPCARTNIAQAFRDELHGTYRSSKLAKQRRRLGNSSLTKSDTPSQGTSDYVPAAAGKFTSSKSMLFYPSMVNSEGHLLQKWHQPSSFACIDASRYSSGRDDSGIIKDALSPIQHGVPSTCYENRAAYDALLSLTYSWESQTDPLENPFEPTPFPELASRNSTDSWERYNSYSW